MLAIAGKFMLVGILFSNYGNAPSIQELQPVQFDTIEDCQERIRILIQQAKVMTSTKIQATCQRIKDK